MNDVRIDGACRIDGEGRAVPVWIRLEAGRLAAVSATPLTPKAGEAVLDATGEIVAPGLVNAHTHSTLAATRGTTDRMDHPAFMWTNQADTVGRSAEEIAAVTTLAAADMLRHGITGVVDHVPEQNATLEGVAPIVEVWRRSGMRVAVALRIFDGAYDDIGDGGYGPADNPLKAEPADVLLARSEEAIQRWHRPEVGLKVYPAPSNSERCGDALLAGAHALAERYDTGFHAHLLETRVQRETCLATRGITPVERLARLGALSARTSFAHCVWCDEADIARMAEAGAVVVHNPHSNAKLGVGLMPLAAMLEAGCTVALGTDGAATNDTLDIHETMALALLLQRASGALARPRWPTARDALAMATAGGAAALLETGMAGTLSVGAWADPVFYRADGMALAPANDLAEQLVFAERGRSVTRVIAAGRTLFEAGRWTTLDVEGALSVAETMRRRRRAH
ncbi:amidohydrolase family protein [Acuticoccus sp. M5D2P5]|uniref:amidohydrolase family protein n=1 Tax=Acuticoccus kalidii TaxID=2910977 RepID=UPI001F17A894|nr:amidohydrolase family protein [Acuticoccus kalidii]MCF3933161.1 amidohydrolase family protein [Acuticoccus kalidii]